VNASVDTRDFAKFARALRQAEPDLYHQLKSELRGAGEIVAGKVRSRASFSSRIPGTVKVRTSGVGVRVIVGGPGAPDAAPIENSGKGFVRHPVFGNKDVWTAKGSRPAFFEPAVREGLPYAAAAAVSALDRAVYEIVKKTEG
jgi:hypothetical protein